MRLEAEKEERGGRVKVVAGGEKGRGKRDEGKDGEKERGGKVEAARGGEINTDGSGERKSLFKVNGRKWRRKRKTLGKGKKDV